jgi:hypothetical protein
MSDNKISLERSVQVLDGCNWINWSDNMTDFLRTQELWKYVDGTCTCPVLAPNASSPVTQDDIIAWTRKDGHALGYIRLRLAEFIKVLGRRPNLLSLLVLVLVRSSTESSKLRVGSRSRSILMKGWKSSSVKKSEVESIPARVRLGFTGLGQAKDKLRSIEGLYTKKNKVSINKRIKQR